MKEKLITSAYPRSGSTYLNQALNLLYYPNDFPNENRHEVVAIQKAQLILVPFRNPMDSIASWHKFPRPAQLDEDINYYIRFYNAVLDNLSKIVLMHFDHFIADIDYIKNKIFKHFGFSTDELVTNDDVKIVMVANGAEINLPRNNQEELNAVKSMLSSHNNFDKCLEIYAQLCNAHESQNNK